VSARRVTGLVLAAALLLTACGRATPPKPVQPATVDCDWHITLQSFPGMDASITPPVTVPARGHQTLTITTNLGVITVDIDLARTPCTAASLDYLVHKHFYDHAGCTRLVPSGAVLQCGDTTGTGEGNPGYEYADENLPTVSPAYHAGDVGMSNNGPDTNGSQFFFVYGSSELPGSYTLWGHVTSGSEVLTRVAAAGDDDAFAATSGGGHPLAPLTFDSVTVGPVH
jgi:peptidyl-prolyl cis-trans isomerase B (cyclophilin B)